jgi:hypothetical protein
MPVPDQDVPRRPGLTHVTNATTTDSVERRRQPILAVHTGAGKGKSTAAFGMARNHRCRPDRPRHSTLDGGAVDEPCRAPLAILSP